MSITTERRIRSTSPIAGSQYAEQIALEMEAVRAGREHYRRLMLEAEKRGDSASLKPVERMLVYWLRPFSEAIRTEKAQCAAGASSDARQIYGPVLRCLKSRELAVIALHETLGTLVPSPGGAKFASLAYAVGRAVVAELHNDRFKDADKGKPQRERLRHQLVRRWRRLTPGRWNWWAKRNLDDPYTSKVLYTQTGGALLWLLIGAASAAGYDEPFKCAFIHEHRRGQGARRPAYVRLAPEVERLIADGHEIRSALRPLYGPMIVPPFEWARGEEGGYVRIRTPFVSKISRAQRAAIEQADMDRTYQAVNALSTAPWRINCAVMKTMAAEAKGGGGTLLLPAFVEHPPPPKPPQVKGSKGALKRHARRMREFDPYDTPYPPRPADYATNEESKNAHTRECRRLSRHNIRARADRRVFGMMMDIARRHAKRTAIYFPHQLDFRGRCYPIPTYLNHHGDDTNRGLLECAHPRPMDDRAWRWLKIHAANTYGIDKGSFDERVAWTDAHMDAIKECARDPRCDFWRHADESQPGACDGKPWQFLAACLALATPSVAERLPVQLDGTCNGLQHYAAMLRDSTGARAVNLLPGDRPADIYADVAAVARREAGVLMEHGDELAAAVYELIGRRTVKQPTMTTVYGVTAVGARQQVESKLHDIIPGDDPATKKKRYQAAMLIANLALKGAREACPAAAAAMDWLTRCAKLIAKKDRLVAWTTPVGFPVVQPYRNWRVATIRTVVQDVRLLIDDENVPVAVGRQVKGAAPNFVHSLDKSHMMRTAIRCRDEGVWFAMIHDSYWTHAADADRLNRILREEFVAMHARPQLEVLRDELRAKHPDIDFPEPPVAGTLDLRQVLDSEYFFS